jgi:HEAT repeat protein
MEEDEELKLYAINSLVASNPERVVPLLKNVIEGPNSPKLKERALFVLAMTKSDEALPVVESLATGEGNPDLQLKAIEYLGMLGGDHSQATLARIYEEGDGTVKRRVLRAYMMMGNRAGVLAAATGNAPVEVRRDAVRQLGAMGGSDELWELYRSSSSTEIKAETIRALAISGDPTRLIELARTESDPALLGDAITMLGISRKPEAAEFLIDLYGSDNGAAHKRDIIKALFIQGNAKALVGFARQETDSDLRKRIVRQLSLMQAPEATDYMMEILGQN